MRMGVESVLVDMAQVNAVSGVLVSTVHGWPLTVTVRSLEVKPTSVGSVRLKDRVDPE